MSRKVKLTYEKRVTWRADSETRVALAAFSARLRHSLGFSVCGFPATHLADDVDAETVVTDRTVTER